MGTVEILERQNEIIRIQSSVIDELYLTLAQHIGTDEAEHLSCVEKIQEAARLRHGIE